MYAKKMSGPRSIPAHPFGANGCQFTGLHEGAPTMMKKMRISSFRNTMPVLNRADS
jgi:hypothetical protein